MIRQRAFSRLIYPQNKKLFLQNVGIKHRVSHTTAYGGNLKFVEFKKKFVLRKEQISA